MRHSLFSRFALPVLAAAASGSGVSAQQVAEIVTFRLNPGVSEAAFLTAAATTEPVLRQTGNMIARTLSRDSDGLWTDHIIWTSMADAKSAAAAAMSDPAFAPFMSMIAPDGVEMRHAPVRLRMD